MRRSDERLFSLEQKFEFSKSIRTRTDYSHNSSEYFNIDISVDVVSIMLHRINLRVMVGDPSTERSDVMRQGMEMTLYFNKSDPKDENEYEYVDS